MPEVLEERKDLAPVYLLQKEKERSRELYEEAFPEDTPEFVNYYYEYKTADNQILVLEKDGKIISMLHLNPYIMIVNGYEVLTDYIVAVATRKEYRHQGYMRTLMEYALQDVGKKEIPFVFLMPASENLYIPFDFVWISSHQELPFRVKKMDADGQNRYLASKYQVFCKRDERYIRNLDAEMAAEENEKISQHIPPYMARITNVKLMLQMTRCLNEKNIYLHIRDSIIAQNDGYYYWRCTREESHIRKLEKVPEKIDIDLTIGELTAMVFESFHIFLSEFV